MAVNSGDTINATDYNTVQSRINTIMNTDYGQSLSSSQVSVGQTVTDTQFDNLRTDITKAYTHQQGVAPTITDVADGDTILAATINQYETLMTSVETNKFLVGSGQSTIEASNSNSTRNTQWGGGGGGVITHTITVNFTSATARIQFFNSGGQIRFSANRSGGSSSSKNTDWTNLLSAMGTVIFNYTDTTASSGTGQSLGGLDLSTSYQNIFTKTGSGNYAENDYNIQARYTGTGNSNIQFQIEFRDDDTGDQQGGFKAGSAVDEYVDGTIESVVQHRRATGSNVQVPAPTYTNNSLL